jgi:hypothetical protein
MMWREGLRRAVALFLALGVLGAAGGGAASSADTEAGYAAFKAAVTVAIAAERATQAAPREDDSDTPLPPRAAGAPALHATSATALRLARGAAVVPDRHGPVPEARAPPRSFG